MDASLLTDYQLYEIMQNKKLHSDIRKLANDEFDKRRITIDNLQDILNKHNKQFQYDNNENLSIKFKVLLIVFPFLIPIHGIIVTGLIPVGHKRKTKEYWFYICVGYLLWTIIIILYCKYFLFKHIIEGQGVSHIAD